MERHQVPQEDLKATGLLSVFCVTGMQHKCTCIKPDRGNVSWGQDEDKIENHIKYTCINCVSKDNNITLGISKKVH